MSAQVLLCSAQSSNQTQTLRAFAAGTRFSGDAERFCDVQTLSRHAESRYVEMPHIRGKLMRLQRRNQHSLGNCEDIIHY